MDDEIAKYAPDGLDRGIIAISGSTAALLYTTNGNWDLVAKIRASSVAGVRPGVARGPHD